MEETNKFLKPYQVNSLKFNTVSRKESLCNSTNFDSSLQNSALPSLKNSFVNTAKLTVNGEKTSKIGNENYL